MRIEYSTACYCMFVNMPIYGRWFVILFATFLSTSILYYFGQLKKSKNIRYGFISAGSVLSTGLFIVGGRIIKLYFENFSRYNILYSSNGSLIILLVWIYYNAFIILIGFELNASIHLSRKGSIE